MQKSSDPPEPFQLMATAICTIFEYKPTVVQRNCEKRREEFWPFFKKLEYHRLITQIFGFNKWNISEITIQRLGKIIQHPQYGTFKKEHPVTRALSD